MDYEVNNEGNGWLAAGVLAVMFVIGLIIG